MPLKALFLVSKFQTPRSIFIFKCTNLKVVYRITLIVLVIGKAQFRRAMLSCDSSCFCDSSVNSRVCQANRCCKCLPHACRISFDWGTNEKFQRKKVILCFKRVQI